MYIKLFCIAHVLENAQNRKHSSEVGHKANMHRALEVLMFPPGISVLSNPPYPYKNSYPSNESTLKVFQDQRDGPLGKTTSCHA